MKIIEEILNNSLKSKLNLACGQDIRPKELNWSNVDVYDGPGVDHMDIYELPWSFENESYDYILAKHILEHIPFHVGKYGYDKNFMIMFMEEVWRVLKVGGILDIIVPGGMQSFCNAIDHKRIVTSKTFHIFYPGDDWSYYSSKKFELLNEKREHSSRFRLSQKIAKKIFDVDIELLSPALTHIVLRKII